MADTACANPASNAKVALTLELEAEIYEAFVRKARLAGLEVEPFLSKTLTVVLACRVFNEQHACSPAAHDAGPETLAKPLKFRP